MTTCSCAHGFICELHADRPWLHDDCIGFGVRCENPACPHGQLAIAQTRIDDAINRMRFPYLFPQKRSDR